MAAVFQNQFLDSAPPSRAWDALLWDSMAQFYPWRELLHRGLQSGELPLWNPHQYCGYPFVGNGQSALFYPLHWLLALLPTGYYLGLSLFLHWLLAGLLTWLLARELGLRAGPALFSALAFQNAGFLVAWALLPTAVNVTVWLPGALWGVERLFRGRRHGLPLLAGSLGLCLLAGHLQFAAYVWLATAAWVLVRAVHRWSRRRAVPIVPLTAAAALGLALAMPQVLPALELGRYSPRGVQQVSAEGWRFQRERAMQPAELVTFLWPEALGDPVTGTYRGFSFTEHCGFAGISTVLLALLALALRRDRWALGLGLGAALALWFALAGLPAYLLYFLVPKLGLAGGFGRILGVYTLCLALLAGLGVQALQTRAEQAPASRRLAPWVPVLAAVLVLVELGPWAVRFLLFAPAASVYPPTELTRQFAATGDEWRSLPLTPREGWGLWRAPVNLLPPNAATAYGWNSPQGYDSLYLGAFRQYARQCEGAEVSPLINGNLLLLNNPASPLLDEASVRWIASLLPLQAPGLVEVEKTRHATPVHLYRNDDALPRVRVTPLDAAGAATLVAADCNRLTVEVDTPGGVLTVADAYYPGWRAWVDGRPGEIRPAGVFREVPLSPGKHWVLLVYHPATVTVGLFLGLLALAVLTAVLVGGGRRGR